MLDNWEKFCEYAELAGVEKWYQGREKITSHHGLPHGLSDFGEPVYIDDAKNVNVSLDTSCCGGWDNTSVKMTFDEFVNTDWQAMHDARFAENQRIENEEKEKKRLAKEKAEKTEYERLKKKFAVQE